MASTRKSIFFRFTTLILRNFSYAFLLISIFSLRVQGQIKAREHKYYREFTFEQGSVLVDKKSLDIFYFGKNGKIKINRMLEGKSFTFQKSEGNKSHFLISHVSNGSRLKKLGYVVRDSQTQFKSQICEPKQTIESNIKKIVSSDLVEKVKELKITDLFDKNSCSALSPERFEEFKKVLLETLNYKQADLQRCLDSEVARKIFLDDPALLDNANEVFSRYLDLIENLRTSKIKFKCGMPKGDENKIASFTQNPLEIAINVIDKKFNLGVKNIKAALNHELFHLGTEQFKTKKGSRCLDEGFVQLFENVCTYADDTTQKKPGQSSFIVESCLKDNEANVEALSLSKKKKSGEGLPTLVAAADLENKDQNKQVTQVVVAAANSSSKSVFETIPDSTVQLAATAPVMTTSGQPLSSYQGDGEFHSVVADSDFSSSVRQLGQSMASSLTNANQLLTTALGATGKVVGVAAVGNTAIAATLGSSSGQYVPLTTSEAFLGRYYSDSKEVQIAMNNPKLDTMTYEQKESYYRSLGGKTKIQSTSDQLASNTGSGVKTTESKVAAVAGKLKAAAQVSTGGVPVTSRTVASLPAQQSEGRPSGAGGVEETAEKAHAENSGATAAQTMPVANSSIKLDNAILQRLTAFSKVNEPAYTRVTERFNDKTFRQQLDARKIRIVGENNKPLWVSSIQPQRCFRDNKTTKVLEVVACK